MTRKKSLRRSEEGAVAAEAAVTISALLLLIIGIIQFALVYWNWNTMLLAVEEAGRYAMLFNNYPNGPPGCTAGSLSACAVDWGNRNGGNLFPGGITSASSTDPNGNPTLTFSATYPFDFLNTITLTRSITVPVI